MKTIEMVLLVKLEHRFLDDHLVKNRLENFSMFLNREEQEFFHFHWK